MAPAVKGADMQYTIEMFPAKRRLRDTRGRAPLAGRRGRPGTARRRHRQKEGGRVLVRVVDRGQPATAPAVKPMYVLRVDAEGRVEPGSNVTGPFEREWIVEGSVMRAVLVGLAAQVASKDKSPVGTIGWRAIAGQDVVAVMFGAARAEQEGPADRGATSLGVDMVYHVSRSELKVLRKTFAR